jgi:hypothetical protein
MADSSDDLLKNRRESVLRHLFRKRYNGLAAGASNSVGEWRERCDDVAGKRA